MKDNEMVTGLISRGDESEKIKLYTGFIDMYVRELFLLRMTKGKSDAEAKRLAKENIHLGFKLMILAPDFVVDSYLRYQAVRLGKDPKASAYACGHFILDIRKDMVPETAVDIETVMDVFPLEG